MHTMGNKGYYSVSLYDIHILQYDPPEAFVLRWTGLSDFWEQKS